VKRKLLRAARSQDGFTLIEVIITSLLSLVVMTGLTSVVLTAMRANDIAAGRIEASGQIRNFELRAYDDFAGSALPSPSGCVATQVSPCTSQPIVLSGKQVANSTSVAPLPYDYTVTYTWDGSAFLDRTTSGNTNHIATNVTGFSWYLDGQTVVVTLTVKVRSYVETQTLRFYPRVN